MNIEIHIDRLVLDGLPIERREAPFVQQAVEAELMRLLQSEGLGARFENGGMVDRVSGESISLPPETNPEGLGTQIAGAVHRSLES